MGAYEDKVRAAIKKRFGSIKKMSESTGIPATTIYHALDRGIDNTTTKTRRMILEYAFPSYSSELNNELNDLEKEVIELFRQLPENAQNAIIANMRAYLEK